MLMMMVMMMVMILIETHSRHCMMMMMMVMILIETHSGHCMMEDDKATPSKAFSTGLDLFFFIFSTSL